MSENRTNPDRLDRQDIATFRCSVCGSWTRMKAGHYPPDSSGDVWVLCPTHGGHPSPGETEEDVERAYLRHLEMCKAKEAFRG